MKLKLNQKREREKINQFYQQQQQQPMNWKKINWISARVENGTREKRGIKNSVDRLGKKKVRGWDTMATSVPNFALLFYGLVELMVSEDHPISQRLIESLGFHFVSCCVIEFLYPQLIFFKSQQREMDLRSNSDCSTRRCWISRGERAIARTTRCGHHAVCCVVSRKRIQNTAREVGHAAQKEWNFD